jgi:hypothetical protein
MTILIWSLSITAYMVLGIFFLNRKLSNVPEKEMRKVILSPIHSIVVLIFWPYFLIKL